MEQNQEDGSFSALNDVVNLDTQLLNTLVLDLTGTFVATILIEYTINGKDYYTLPLTKISDGSPATSLTGTGTYKGDVSAYAGVRARCSAYTSGTPKIAMRAVEGTGPVRSTGVAMSVADGADVTLGTKADAAITDATQTGTLMSFLKGAVKILADVWDSALHRLNVLVFGATTTLTATIANGASLSGEIDLSGYSRIGFFMPAAWTAANLTFQGSNATGGTFQDIYDSAGNELVVTAAVSRSITDIPELAPFRFIKVRSGTTGTPVAQGASRDIIVILKS